MFYSVQYETILLLRGLLPDSGVNYGEVGMYNNPKVCEKIENLRNKKIVILAKFGKVNLVKIPFGYYFMFNLRIGAEEATVHHTWPGCASN